MHLVPTYRQKLKAEKRRRTKTREIKQWTCDGMEELRGCFESTELSVFFDSCSSHHELAETVTDNLRFCEDCLITSKSVRIFPNNKPWVTKDLKIYLNKKKYAFIERELDKEVRGKAKLAKLAYKDQAEEKLKVGNAKDAWRGLNTVIGRKHKQETVKTDDPRGFAKRVEQVCCQI